MNERFVEKECPRCGSDFLLRYKDPSNLYRYKGWLYCPQCDTLYNKEMHAMVRTVEPYADFGTFIKGWRR